MLNRKNIKSKEENNTLTLSQLMNNSTEIKKFSLWSNKVDLRNCNIQSEMITYVLNFKHQEILLLIRAIIIMKSFLKQLNNQQQSFYHKVYLITGIIPDPKKISDKQIDKTTKELTNQQTFDLCRFSNREVYSNPLKNLIQLYRQTETGNTCLHVAGQYGNMSIINYILKNNLIDCNYRNKFGDTTLMHTLRNSNSNFFQKSVLLLSKYSDLSLVDSKNKRSDEITLTSYSKSRARIMQLLCQEYIARTKQ